MIPRIIHCCWFGGKPKSALIDRCMASWHRFAPNYEFEEWNEERFDVAGSPYVSQAYATRKWAFVSDYVRLKVLYERGGIYLDTDVELLASPDRFLQHRAFTGFENFKGTLSPITAVMGAEPRHPWIARLFADYDSADFLDSQGRPVLLTNTERIRHVMVAEYGVQLVDRQQEVRDGLVIYPSGVLCNPSRASCAVHHFNGSWIPRTRKLRAHLGDLLRAFPRISQLMRRQGR